MVAAAASGAIDFTKMDPRDKLWWRKLQWIIRSVRTQNQLAALETQHNHWVTMFANASLDSNSFANTKQAAQSLLDAILDLRFPEEATGRRRHTGSTQDVINEFRETYGYPGEPRYEKMLADMMAAFKQLEDE